MSRSKNENIWLHVSEELQGGGFEVYLTEQLERYSLKLEVFQSTILFGLTIKSTSIYKLNKLGKYGLLEVKKMIAEYAGLQYGEYWGKLESVNIKGRKVWYYLRPCDDSESESDSDSESF